MHVVMDLKRNLFPELGRQTHQGHPPCPECGGRQIMGLSSLICLDYGHDHPAPAWWEVTPWYSWCPHGQDFHQLARGVVFVTGNWDSRPRPSNSCPKISYYRVSILDAPVKDSGGEWMARIGGFYFVGMEEQ